ncbi:Aste57867_13686 [Aphanomyces stellatus]|uniref:Aste57867_13686 protein n=1 Tax=Aphanomyces stellatus TaxID=120398 RepID=A0A485KYS6_9STRA|nr:hypothetical protein As57867_013636 [Aphanomyces stellatus]VFT90519.1 Aste57867_13686 [Aphanomyces stellatus]
MKIGLACLMGLAACSGVQAWNAMEWIESATANIFVRSGVASGVPEIKSVRSCSRIAIEWTPLTQQDAVTQTYLLERRPDLNAKWEWASIAQIESSDPVISWEDQYIDPMREYTYRLRVASSNSSFSFATAPVSASCLQWGELGMATLHSLRFRVECVLPAVLRMLVFLAVLHVVMLCWRKYNDITFSPPKKFKATPAPPSSPGVRLTLRKQRSCSSTGSESECFRDSDVSSADRMSTWSTRESEMVGGATATCSACLKKFGLFRKRTLCTVCSSNLCRGCSRANRGKCLCVAK